MKQSTTGEPNKNNPSFQIRNFMSWVTKKFNLPFIVSVHFLNALVWKFQGELCGIFSPRASISCFCGVRGRLNIISLSLFGSVSDAMQDILFGECVLLHFFSRALSLACSFITSLSERASARAWITTWARRIERCSLCLFHHQATQKCRTQRTAWRHSAQLTAARFSAKKATRETDDAD